MSRQGWKKRTCGRKAPREFADFCCSVFLALSYDEPTLESAVDYAVRKATGQQRSALRQYLRCVEELGPGIFDALDQRSRENIERHHGVRE